ncbi:hypothetical protein ACQKD0_16490, partial [Vreelandella aquamarina]|uniref:hypothetical protein n=1 Tax=Vreelandella aquamarina TaxID=77097 RepID=UPI003CFC72A3
AKANLHGANDQKVLAGGDRESVGAGFTDSGIYLIKLPAVITTFEFSACESACESAAGNACGRALQRATIQPPKPT